jgi:hypothetical protein
MLPVVGARLVRFYYLGYPKDSWAHIEAEGAPRFLLGLSGACIDLALSGPILVTTRGQDDLNLKIEVVPSAAQTIMIEDAAVLYLGGDENWAKDIVSWTERDEPLGWAVELLRLRFVAI